LRPPEKVDNRQSEGLSQDTYSKGQQLSAEEPGQHDGAHQHQDGWLAELYIVLGKWSNKMADEG